MFVPVWLFFLASGTLMAILVLVWAIRNHQFEDQERARYLPLNDVPAAELSKTATMKRTPTYWGFVVILAFNAIAITTTLVVAILNM
jgi:nitrogen fixation-related uncharacterized protein